MDVQAGLVRVNGIPAIESFHQGSAEKRPLLILMHGFNGSKRDLSGAAQQYARAGFFAVSVDLHRHGDLGQTPFIPARVSPHLDEVIEQSARNLDGVIGGYQRHPLVDAGRVYLLGVSLGGAVIYRYLPNRSPSVRAAACMIAGCDPFWEKTFRSIMRVYPEFGITEEFFARAAAIVRDRPFLEGAGDFPLLMQYGRQDPIVPVDEVRKVYEQVRKHYSHPERIRLSEYEPCGHETPPAMYEEALVWFREWGA